MPTLSIIIPVYNVEKYLRQCLDSVLVDNGFTGQVICVNDGSTDGSAAILVECAKKYSNIEIITQQNAGLSAARNAGLDRATGDYVFFLDSDDWIIPGAIDKIMQQINGEDVVYFNAKIFNEKKQRFGREIDIQELKNMDGQAYLAAIYGQPRNMPCVCVWGGFYRRLFLKENHLYNEAGIYHEDNYFTPQVLLAAHDVSCINEYVYVYRTRNGSITSRVTEKHIKDYLFIIRNLYSLYTKKGDVSDVFYTDVCNICVCVILDAYRNCISLRGVWKRSDSKIMLRCAYDERSKRIAKLTYLSPLVAYWYLQDKLPSIVRRFVNRYL
jgi:heptose III glucuronosyltransferase